MDELATKMLSIKWSFGDKDEEALKEMERRIAEAGKGLRLITYSNLVSGVVFHLSQIRDGGPYEIRIHELHGLDRKIVGEFLGLASTRSYLAGGFIASA